MRVAASATALGGDQMPSFQSAVAGAWRACNTCHGRGAPLKARGAHYRSRGHLDAVPNAPQATAVAPHDPAVDDYTASN